MKAFKNIINRGAFFYRIKNIARHIWKESMSGVEYVDYLRKQGVRIGKNVNFRYPSHSTIDITRPCLVEFGNDIDINDNFTILTHDFATFVFRGCFNDFVNSSGKVKIGNNVVFGRNVTILKGVTVGDNCVIGAGSILSKSIPSNSVAVGSPARVVCSIEEYYKKRKALQIKEALEYGKELALIRGGFEHLKISDFTEEWVLFLSEEEYNMNDDIKKLVDVRLKDKVSAQEFLQREKVYTNFTSFLDAIRKEESKI